MTEQVTINKTDKPNSVNFRSAGTGSPEWKFYFNDEEDAFNQIRACADSERIQQAITDLKARGAQ